MSTVHEYRAAEVEALTATTAGIERSALRLKNENAQLAEALRRTCSLAEQLKAGKVTSQRELVHLRQELRVSRTEGERLRARVTMLSSTGGGGHKDGTSGSRRSGLATGGARSDAGGMHPWSTGSNIGRAGALGQGGDGPRLSREFMAALREEELGLARSGTTEVLVAEAFAARLEEDARNARATLPPAPSDPYAQYTPGSRDVMRAMDTLLAQPLPTTPTRSLAVDRRVTREPASPHQRSLLYFLDRRRYQVAGVRSDASSFTVEFEPRRGVTINALDTSRMLHVVYNKYKYTPPSVSYLNNRVIVRLQKVL